MSQHLPVRVVLRHLSNFSTTDLDVDPAKVRIERFILFCYSRADTNQVIPAGCDLSRTLFLLVLCKRSAPELVA